MSLNKPAFTLLWLNLESFLHEAKDPHLAALPRDSPETWHMTILTCPNFVFLKHHDCHALRLY